MKYLGSINACGIATLYNGQNKVVGTCLDTPNNIAAAFLLIENAFFVKFENLIRTRSYYTDRMIGLDMNYHKQYIKVM